MILPGLSSATTPAGGDVGFSFSPGGLLLPYHMGAADCLVRARRLDPASTFVAGSSAGAIAAAAIGCGLDPVVGLEGTIAISERCRAAGVGARGNLGPLLQEQLEGIIDDEAFAFLRARWRRPGPDGGGGGGEDDADAQAGGTGVALAYREVFPAPGRSILQTTFASRADLFRAVGYSCAFPFFTTNLPCAVDFGDGGGGGPRLPRLLVDGYFALPREQFGCPVLEEAFPDAGVARTVAIACIPQELFGMDAVFDGDSNNLISIDGDDEDDPLGTAEIFRIATQPSSREELTALFERGYRDAERWCRREDDQRDKEARQN